MTTAGAILAAGGGSRFEGAVHKLLIPFNGRPVIEWAVAAALASGLDQMFLITGAVEFDIAGVTTVQNPRWNEGQAGSLQVAIAAAAGAGHSDLVVGLGDQPLVTAAAWRSVAAATTPIAVATYGSRRGHPVRLAAEVWPLLPARGDAGARVLFAARPDLVTEVPCDGSPADIDTLDDLAALDSLADEPRGRR